VGYVLYSYNTQPNLSPLNDRVAVLEGKIAGLRSQLTDLMNNTPFMTGTSLVTVAGQQIYAGGELIVGIGSERIRTMDDLSSYLEMNSMPELTMNFTAVREAAR
jgi:hypothetical protein